LDELGEQYGLSKAEQESLIRLVDEKVFGQLATARNRPTEIRLKALQKLSQLVDPQGIAPLIEVLTDSASNVRLRREAAYGLGRYSENPAFREYYPEIFSGFREVLDNPETPRELAMETMRTVLRFGTDAPGELTSLFQTLGLEQRAEAGPVVKILARQVGCTTRKKTSRVRASV
jgi:HEAT repeat protein